MSRRIRFTRLAEERLADIARWTIQTFGPRQADLYERELIERCAALAAGQALSRDCSVLAPEGQGMRYTRAGEHILIFVARDEEIVIIDILHSRSDLPKHIARLSGP